MDLCLYSAYLVFRPLGGLSHYLSSFTHSHTHSQIVTTLRIFTVLLFLVVLFFIRSHGVLFFSDPPSSPGCCWRRRWATCVETTPLRVWDSTPTTFDPFVVIIADIWSADQASASPRHERTGAQPSVRSTESGIVYLFSLVGTFITVGVRSLRARRCFERDTFPGIA